MASRKRTQKTKEKTIEKRWDFTGIAVAAFGIMLLLALITYDKNDFTSQASPQKLSNWVGIFGAYLAKGELLVFGLCAYIIPLIFVAWGLSIPITALQYLQRRWPWMILLSLALCCGLDIYKGLFPSNLCNNLSTISPGGYVGYYLYTYFFFLFGKVGSTVILITLYIISIISLTNINLDEWVKMVKEKIREYRVEMAKQMKENARKAEEREKKQQMLLAAKTEAREKEAREQAERAEREAQEAKARKDAAAAKAAAEAETQANQNTEEPLDIAPLDDAPTQEPVSHSKSKKSDTPGTYKIIDAYSPEKLSKKRETSILPTQRCDGNYKLPSTELLQEAEPIIQIGDTESEMIQNAECIRQTLAEFNVEVKPSNITRGPTVTLYEFLPAKGIKMSRITALNDNLAAALKAVSLNILAPIPGKNSVGIEVPNKEKVKVIMRELLESPEWVNSKARIPVALGKDIYGKAIIADLAEMPHLLVAGSTGSGKSVCINAIVASLLYKFSPEELRFVMVDPKVVELQQYSHLPHMIVPVVTDPKKVVLTLKWVVNEMEKRYKIFAKVKARNIKDFNAWALKSAAERAKVAEETAAQGADVPLNNEGVAVELDEEISVPRDEELTIPDRLSYIVLIIDELADLMLVAGKDVEMLITRITQMARAAGIHCIVATQRPSVDIITGVIKSNIPTRIAFQVAGPINSRTILDATGAEKLLGKGDMLFLPPGSAKTTRIQGALITDKEIESVLNYISSQAKPEFFEDFLKQLNEPESGEYEASEDDEDEDLIQDCIDVILSEKRASTSILQRRLRLGYNRAARIMDILERRNIVGPSRGSRDREILMKDN